jgi:hypothetical protein
MSLTQGLQLPFGIQPVNPVPVDSWSGPYDGVSLQDAIDLANLTIPVEIRFQSMEVRLIVGGESRKFWYRDGVDDTDLIEFGLGPIGVTGATGATGPQGPTGITGATGPQGADGGIPTTKTLISGGAEWSGTGMTFSVSLLTYTFTGVVLNAGPTSITLGASDPTNPRIDAIVVDESGNITSIAGVSSPDPATPAIPENQCSFVKFSILKICLELIAHSKIHFTKYAYFCALKIVL